MKTAIHISPNSSQNKKCFGPKVRSKWK